VHGFFAVGDDDADDSDRARVVRNRSTLPGHLQDSLFGGQVAWGIADNPTLILLIVIAVQRGRSDER
jgi:hypothetical protein